MIEWSDPALLDAIRVAEAALAGAGVGPTDHFKLADLRKKRRSPRRPPGFTMPFSPTAQLEQAWEALYSTWRFKIESGAISLKGSSTLPVLNPGTIELPKERAAEFLFDPAAGAVFIGLSTYVGVTATRTGRVAPTAESTTTCELPLADALIEWGDPNLVQRLRKLEERKAEFLKQDQQRATLPAGVKLVAVHRSPEELSLPAALEAVRKALVEDLRKKIERGTLSIAGVQTYPVREFDRKPIPGYWASDFWFDIPADKVSIVQFNRATHIYVATVIAGPKRSLPDSKGDAPAVAARGPASPAKSSDASAGSRGRPNFGPIIEAAVREHWEELQRWVREGGKLVWAEAARMLEKRLKARVKLGEVIDIPHVETIRTRLPEIYAQVLSEKAASSNITQ